MPRKNPSASRMLAIVAMAVVMVVGITLNNRRIDSITQPEKPAIQEPAPQEHSGPTPSPDLEQDLSLAMWKAVFYGSLILGVLIVGAWALKRYGGDRFAQASSPEMRVVGRRYLNPKQSIVIVKVREKELLLGITDHTIQLLYDLTPEEKEESGMEFAVTPAEAET